MLRYNLLFFALLLHGNLAFSWAQDISEGVEGNPIHKAMLVKEAMPREQFDSLLYKLEGVVQLGRSTPGSLTEIEIQMEELDSDGHSPLEVGLISALKHDLFSHTIVPVNSPIHQLQRLLRTLLMYELNEVFIGREDCLSCKWASNIDEYSKPLQMMATVVGLFLAKYTDDALANEATQKEEMYWMMTTLLKVSKPALGRWMQLIDKSNAKEEMKTQVTHNLTVIQGEVALLESRMMASKNGQESIKSTESLLNFLQYCVDKKRFSEEIAAYANYLRIIGSKLKQKSIEEDKQILSLLFELMERYKEERNLELLGEMAVKTVYGDRPIGDTTENHLRGSFLVLETLQTHMGLPNSKGILKTVVDIASKILHPFRLSYLINKEDVISVGRVLIYLKRFHDALNKLNEIVKSIQSISRSEKRTFQETASKISTHCQRAIDYYQKLLESKTKANQPAAVKRGRDTAPRRERKASPERVLRAPIQQAVTSESETQPQSAVAALPQTTAAYQPQTVVSVREYLPQAPQKTPAQESKERAASVLAREHQRSVSRATRYLNDHAAASSSQPAQADRSVSRPRYPSYLHARSDSRLREESITRPKHALKVVFREGAYEVYRDKLEAHQVWHVAERLLDDLRTQGLDKADRKKTSYKDVQTKKSVYEYRINHELRFYCVYHEDRHILEIILLPGVNGPEHL